MKNLRAHHHFAIVSLLTFGIVSLWTWGSVVFASDTQITVQIGPPDACKNIPGYQQDIPEGMQAENGNCFSPTPPVEPCTTACEPAGSATDYCENIDGAQEKIPVGMRRDDAGTCFTPAQLSRPDLPPTATSEEPVRSGAFGLPDPWHIDIGALGNIPSSFLTPQVVAVIVTATVAVGSLAIVRHHHHKIGPLKPHRRA